MEEIGDRIEFPFNDHLTFYRVIFFLRFSKLHIAKQILFTQYFTEYQLHVWLVTTFTTGVLLIGLKDQHCAKISLIYANICTGFIYSISLSRQGF